MRLAGYLWLTVCSPRFSPQRKSLFQSWQESELFQQPGDEVGSSIGLSAMDHRPRSILMSPRENGLLRRSMIEFLYKSFQANVLFSRFLFSKNKHAFLDPGVWSFFASCALREIVWDCAFSLWCEPVRQLGKVSDLFEDPAFELSPFQTVIPIHPYAVDS